MREPNVKPTEDEIALRRALRKVAQIHLEERRKAYTAMRAQTFRDRNAEQKEANNAS